MILKNKHILITGATGGIGRAFAEMCAKENAHLYLVIRKPDPDLQIEIQRKGASAVTVFIRDLSIRAEVDALIDEMKNINLDILFNNAGLLTGGLLEEQPLDDIYKMIQVNLNSVIHLTQGLLPGMLKRRSGKIINNSSVSAYMNFPCATTYAASKAAVAAFTHSLELELTGTGVSTLLLVTPGIKTKMFDAIKPLYGKNLQVPDDSISTETYASMIKDSLEKDNTILAPSLLSMTGVGLRIAKYAPPLFKLGVLNKFKR